jgi:hypothetical protein
MARRFNREFLIAWLRRRAAPASKRLYVIFMAQYSISCKQPIVVSHMV